MVAAWLGHYNTAYAMQAAAAGLESSNMNILVSRNTSSHGPLTVVGNTVHYNSCDGTLFPHVSSLIFDEW